MWARKEALPEKADAGAAAATEGAVVGDEKMKRNIPLV